MNVYIIILTSGFFLTGLFVAVLWFVKQHKSGKINFQVRTEVKFLAKKEQAFVPVNAAEVLKEDKQDKSLQQALLLAPSKDLKELKQMIADSRCQENN